MGRAPKPKPTKIKASQIEVAAEIQERLPLWSNTDKALNALNDRYRGFSLDACLVKAAAVNALYATYVLAITKMAQHVYEVLGQKELSSINAAEAICLVEELAKLRLLPIERDQEHQADEIATQPRERRFRSFASKFCAFYVAAERFPIFDEAAREAIKLHLPAEEIDRANDYGAFVRNVDAVRAWSGLHDVKYKEIDRYLWLRGMHQRYEKGDERVNAELQYFFRQKPPELSLLIGL